MEKLDAPDDMQFRSTSGLGSYFQGDTEYEVHLRWGDRGNGTSANVPSTNELVAYPDNIRWRVLSVADIFGGASVIRQFTGQQSILFQNDGVNAVTDAAEVNVFNGVQVEVDPAEPTRALITQPDAFRLPDSPGNGRVPRWNAGAGVWEASLATRGTKAQNHVLVDGLTLVFTNSLARANQIIIFNRSLVEDDRGRLVLIDGVLDDGSNNNEGRAPFMPVLADSLLDLDRTPFPPTTSDFIDADADHIAIIAARHGGQIGIAANAGNYLLYYCGSVLTRLTAEVTSTTATDFTVPGTGNISVGDVLYLDYEAVLVTLVNTTTSF